MKNLILAFLAVFGLTACSDTIELETNTTEPTVEIAVDFDDSVTSQDILKAEKELGINFVPNSPFYATTKIMTAVVPTANLEEIEEGLEDLGNVESASVNYLIRLVDPVPMQVNNYTNHFSFGENKKPNDPLYNKQWNFDMVKAEQAWKRSTGEGVVVAVIDTGVSDGTGRYGRVPDLGNTEFVPGFNFVDKNSDPYDKYGHGTHVAGTIAQSTNNGIGVAGLAYGAAIMPIKVLSDQGYGSTANIAEGIRWAADNGAHVINLSLGGGAYSAILEAAVAYAAEKEVFLACAAGNGQRALIEFPAGYDGCHAISAVDASGNIAWYSSYGESKLGTKLFLAAPGGDTTFGGPEGGVLQDTVVEGDPTRHGYFPYQGTSMATPHVAGAAALVISAMGVDDYTVEEVADYIADSAKKRDSFDRYGEGVLNAGKAVHLAVDEEEESLFAKFLLLMMSLGAAILVKITE